MFKTLDFCFAVKHTTNVLTVMLFDSQPGLDDQLLTKLIGVDFGKESGAKQPDTQQKTLW